jgi:hypothetical protein
MLYLSKPNGTHAVFIGTRSQGAYDIFALRPGSEYRGQPPAGDFVGERDHFTEAKAWADSCDRSIDEGALLS